LSRATFSAVHATVRLGDDQLVRHSVSVGERNGIYFIFQYLEHGDQIFDNSVGGPIRIPFSRMQPR
jgi:hypothetical protein